MSAPLLGLADLAVWLMLFVAIDIARSYRRGILPALELSLLQQVFFVNGEHFTIGGRLSPEDREQLHIFDGVAPRLHGGGEVDSIVPAGKRRISRAVPARDTKDRG